MCCIVVLCAAAFLKRIVNGTSAKQTVCKWQIFLLKDVAHWSSWSFHWLLWKKFHLLCSTLKRWKEGSEFKLIKKPGKLIFWEEDLFFFLGMCSFWIHAAWKCKASKAVHFPCVSQVVHNSNSTLWKISRILQGIMVCHREYEYLSVSVEQLSSFHFVFIMFLTLGSHIFPLISRAVHGNSK